MTEFGKKIIRNNPHIDPDSIKDYGEVRVGEEWVPISEYKKMRFPVNTEIGRVFSMNAIGKE